MIIPLSVNRLSYKNILKNVYHSFLKPKGQKSKKYSTYNDVTVRKAANLLTGELLFCNF